MAQITLPAERTKQILSVVGVIVMILTAGIAIYVGLQLDRNQAPDDAAADLGNCRADNLGEIVCEAGLSFRCILLPDLVTYEWVAIGACTNNCTSRICTAWGTCIGGSQTCTTYNNLPAGCTGGVSDDPPETQSCTVSTSNNLCTAYTCTQWGACNNGVQTCITESYTPIGCVGGVQPPDPYTQSCSSPTSTGQTGSRSSAGTTTTDTSCDSPTDRPNGCKCNRDEKCISNYCHPDTGTCERPPECQGDSRPNGCQCSNPDKCASGICSGGFCVGGGGGELPDTGLFDDNGGVLLLGMGLLTLGMFNLFAGRGKQAPLYTATEVKPVAPRTERNTDFESSFLQNHTDEEEIFGGDNEFESKILQRKK